MAAALAGKPEAFRKAGWRSRSEDRCGLLTWTAVGLATLGC